MEPADETGTILQKDLVKSYLVPHKLPLALDCGRESLSYELCPRFCTITISTKSCRRPIDRKLSTFLGWFLHEKLVQLKSWWTGIYSCFDPFHIKRRGYPATICMSWSGEMLNADQTITSDTPTFLGGWESERWGTEAYWSTSPYEFQVRYWVKHVTRQ